VAAAMIVPCVAGKGTAQQRETITADFTFYGDNTEFANAFREGETLLGVSGQIALEVEVGDHVRVVGGVFGNQRFGSARAFEQVRPVLALVAYNDRHQFRMGTLAPPDGLPLGPDRQTLHGLLPPLHAETLSLTRPWEAGLQWTTTTFPVKQDAWINWQRLNTSKQRERFDTGIAGTWDLGHRTTVVYQWHLVHEGGQQFAVGPVADSQALAIGPRFTVWKRPRGELSLEAVGLVSRFVPDREVERTSRTGQGLFLRAAASQSGWRGHVIVFRGWDYVKVEGDPHYLSIRRDGTAFRRVRDYQEAGIARQFRPAARVAIEASARLHRVETQIDYSYRIIGRTHLAWPLR
jgi:hypothetical protein